MVLQHSTKDLHSKYRQVQSQKAWILRTQSKQMMASLKMKKNIKLKGKRNTFTFLTASVLKCFFRNVFNFSVSNDQKTFVIGLGDVIPVRPFHSDSLIECLAEVRMIWRDKVEQTLLLSLRIYCLPENTPKGRLGHGEVRLKFKNQLFDCKCATVFLLHSENRFSFIKEEETKTKSRAVECVCKINVRKTIIYGKYLQQKKNIQFNRMCALQ